MGVREVYVSVEILLVEDNAADRRLTEEALKEGKIINKLHSVVDGIEAENFLKQRGKYKNVPRPDLILLDLNLPRKDGRELLAEIKKDKDLKKIPVIVLTTSKAEEDVLKSYNLHANCYIVKPVDLDKFFSVVREIENFWLRIVKLSPRQ